MNDHYNYVPDGSHRHHEIEKVQREILQQHKYLETQLNQLRDTIRGVCDNNAISCPTTYRNRPPSRYFDESQRFGDARSPNEVTTIHKVGVRKF